MIQKASGIILMYLLRSTLCIPLSEFYSFGPNTAEPSQRLGDGDSVTSANQPVTNNNLYFFYGDFETVITVSYK